MMEDVQETEVTVTFSGDVNDCTVDITGPKPGHWTRPHVWHWMWGQAEDGRSRWLDMVRCGTCGRERQLMRNDL